MSLPAFLIELEKIALSPPSPSKPIPINAVAPRGPSVPHPGGLKPIKLAALGARTVLPAATVHAGFAGRQAMPAAAKTVEPLTEEAAKGLRATQARRGFMAPGGPRSIAPAPASGTFSIPPKSQVTPPSSATSNTIPAGPAGMSAPTMRSPAPGNAAQNAVTVPPPARMPKVAYLKLAFAGPMGAPPVAAPGAMPAAPAPITPSSGRAYAAMRGVLAGPKKPSMTMKVGEDPNPPHGTPGHNHVSTVDKLRAAVKAKHPHLVKDKIASVADYMGRALGAESRIGKHLVDNAHAYDLGGLGILAVPAAHNLGHQASNAANGKDVDKTEAAHAGLELAGLGTLAAPTAIKMLHGGH